MTPLTQQLEDKKKGCGVEIVKEQSYISEYGKFKTAKVICGKVYDGDLILCPKCREIIAILEQAIAEMQKQRQEILEIIDKLPKKDIEPRDDDYGLWTEIKDSKYGLYVKVEDLELLKQQLTNHSQQVSGSLAVTSSMRNGCNSADTRKGLEVGR